MERETIEKDIDKIITSHSDTNSDGESIFGYESLHEDLVDYVEKIYKEFSNDDTSEWTPKYGEEIWVSNDDFDGCMWFKRIFVGMDLRQHEDEFKGYAEYVCLSKEPTCKHRYCSWIFAKPLSQGSDNE